MEENVQNFQVTIKKLVRRMFSILNLFACADRSLLRRQSLIAAPGVQHGA